MTAPTKNSNLESLRQLLTRREFLRTQSKGGGWSAAQQSKMEAQLQELGLPAELGNALRAKLKESVLSPEQQEADAQLFSLDQDINRLLTDVFNEIAPALAKRSEQEQAKLTELLEPFIRDSERRRFAVSNLIRETDAAGRLRWWRGGPAPTECEDRIKFALNHGARILEGQS